MPDTSIARPQLLPEPESRHSPVRHPSTTSQVDSDDEDDEVEMVEEEEVVMSEIINDGCHVCDSGTTRLLWKRHLACV